MKSVLITRPEPDATETAARVAAMGYTPIVAPVMSVIQTDVRAPERLAATVLTSRNAVAACPASVHGYPVFAVGAATAKRAEDAGFGKVLNANGDAKALVELIGDTMSPQCGSLFLPTGQGQGSALAALLRQRGFDVILSVAYRTVGLHALPDAADKGLRQHHIAIAMFFSGETAQHFVRLVRAADLDEHVRDVEAVAISERAALALRPLPWRRIKVALKPNQDEMLVLLND